jgi:hypothetical protein
MLSSFASPKRRSSILRELPDCLSILLFLDHILPAWKPSSLCLFPISCLPKISIKRQCSLSFITVQCRRQSLLLIYALS